MSSLTTGIIITEYYKKHQDKHDKILVLTKSKLNIIKTLVSQELIDMEISHEEFITILKEKDKYEKMKENLRNINEKLEEKTENTRLNSVNSRTYIFFLVSVYKKMCQISKKAYEKCEIEIIDNKEYFWLNRRGFEIESDYQNWSVIFNKCDPENENIDTN